MDSIKKTWQYNITFRNTLNERESQTCILTLNFTPCDKECDICTYDKDECYDKNWNKVDGKGKLKFIIIVSVIIILTLFLIIVLVIFAYKRGFKFRRNISLNENLNNNNTPNENLFQGL